MGTVILGEYDLLTHTANKKKYISSLYFTQGEQYFVKKNQIKLDLLYSAVLYGYRNFMYKGVLTDPCGEYEKQSEDTIKSDIMIERSFMWALAILKRSHFPSDLLSTSKNKKTINALPKNPKCYTQNKELFLKSFQPFCDFFDYKFIEYNSGTEKDRSLIVNRITTYKKILDRSELNFFQFPNRILSFDDIRQLGAVILLNVVSAKLADFDPILEFNKSKDRFRKRKIVKKPHELTRIDKYSYKYKKTKKRGKNNFNKPSYGITE